MSKKKKKDIKERNELCVLGFTLRGLYKKGRLSGNYMIHIYYMGLREITVMGNFMAEPFVRLYM